MVQTINKVSTSSPPVVSFLRHLVFVSELLCLCGTCDGFEQQCGLQKGLGEWQVLVNEIGDCRGEDDRLCLLL